MKTIKLFSVILAAVLGSAYASNTANQTITVTVNAYDEVGVSGNLSFTFGESWNVSLGQAPQPLTDNSTNLVWSTNADAARTINVKLQGSLPAGFTSLKLWMTMNGSQPNQGSATATNLGSALTLTTSDQAIVNVGTSGVNVGTASGGDDVLNYQLTIGTGARPTGETPVVITVVFTIS